MRPTSNALAAVLLACAALPATAAAGTASVEVEEEIGRGGEGQYAVYRAAPAEANRVTARLVAHGVTATATITDTAGTAAGPGCVRPDPGDTTRVTCELGKSEFAGIAPHSLRFELGDLDDVAAIVASPEATGKLDGGAGNDVLTAGDGLSPTLEGYGIEGPFGAELSGGPGDDVLRGGAQDDSFGSEGAGPDGSDTILAGPGFDSVSYHERTAAVQLDLDGVRDDGADGERDRIVAAEGLGGGAGDDRLTGSGAGNDLTGGAGTDRLTGGAGNDLLSDQLDSADRSADSFSGGAGSDYITAGSGPNRIDAGAGVDFVEAGAGDDVVTARDGSTDSVRCDPGSDRVGADALDFAEADCERVHRRGRPRAVGIFLPTFPLGTLGTRQRPYIGPRVGCPVDRRGGCRVRVTLRRRRAVLGAVSMRLQAGSSREAFIYLNVTGRRLLSRLRSQRRTAAIRVSVRTRLPGGRGLRAVRRGRLVP